MANDLFINLDAMIQKADVAPVSGQTAITNSNISAITLRDFSHGGIVDRFIRKPAFQRDTVSWEPEQAASFIDSFVRGEPIQPVMLCRSSAYLFVIDGCHRLSILKGWAEDDYGDGAVSMRYFGGNIPATQKESAMITRRLISTNVGPYRDYEDRALNPLIIEWIEGELI